MLHVQRVSNLSINDVYVFSHISRVRRQKVNTTNKVLRHVLTENISHNSENVTLLFGVLSHSVIPKVIPIQGTTSPLLLVPNLFLKPLKVNF